MNIQKQLEQLCSGTVSVIPREELLKKLSTKRPLTIKLGVDPTAADLHLGHAVVLSKLRQFQDFGHQIIFIIGDFTARIGDPTGKSKTRPPLNDEQIKTNTKTYLDQVGKILDPAKTTIRYNAEWLDKITLSAWIEICAKVTVARIIEREDFATRLAQKQPISLHEIMYPLLQGYDSVELEADVELGGTDQTFNLLIGRQLQESFGQEPQVVMTVPLLEGLDGINKMSKSLNNYIGLNEPATAAFGKIMSISDELMWRYYSVLLHISNEEIDKLKHAVATEKQHPLTLKKQLAHKIIERFWSTQEAETALSSFEQLFQQKDFSSAQEVTVRQDGSMTVLDLVRALTPDLSSSQIRRLIGDSAISINEEKKLDPFEQIALTDQSSDTVVKVGKHRFFKVKR